MGGSAQFLGPKKEICRNLTCCALRYHRCRQLLVPVLSSPIAFIPFKLSTSAATHTPPKMSFADIEAGLGPSRSPSSSAPQSKEDNAFQSLQSSLSLQVFKMNANVQGILKLVDQLGTGKDSAALRKSLYAALRPPPVRPQLITISSLE